MRAPALPAAAGVRGFTLLEIMVVVVLAGLVTLGLVAFYLQSQSMWMDASSQALAQRDATALVEMMRGHLDEAAKALVLPSNPGGTNHLLILYDTANNEIERFWWHPADSMVHHGVGAVDGGAVMPTLVERFRLSLDATLPLVHLDTLRVRSSTGQRVHQSTTFALYNGTPL